MRIWGKDGGGKPAPGASLSASKPGQARPHNRYLLPALAALALLFPSMQFSMVAITLPTIIDDLNSPLRWAGWLVTIYILAFAISMVIVGKLGEMFGVRRVYLASLAGFGASSLACALAPNIYLLILARAAQGFSAGVLGPSTNGIVGDAFPSNRSQAIGFVSSFLPIGSVIGPNLGGLIVDTLGWRWTFGFNAPFALLFLVAAIFLMPKTEPERAGGLDFLNVGLLAAGIAALIYGLTELSQRPADMPVVTIALLTFLIVGASFILRERRSRNPVLDRDLITRKEFVPISIVAFLYGFLVIGVFSYIPLYAQVAYDMSAGKSGLILTPRAFVMIAISTTASVLLPRTGYRRPILMGLAILSVALLIMSRGVHEPTIFGIHFSNFAYLSIVVALTGVAFGMSNPAQSTAAIELVPDRIPAITGLRGMLMLLGGTVGSAVVILIASRASSQTAGLELAFFLMAGMSLLVALVALRIPHKMGQPLEAQPVVSDSAAPISPAQAPDAVRQTTVPER